MEMFLYSIPYTLFFVVFILLTHISNVIDGKKMLLMKYAHNRIIWGVLVAWWLKCWPAIERLQVQALLGTGFFHL